MINVTDLRPNKTYEDEGEIYVVIDVLLNKTAMAKMKAVVKRKNLRTGTTTEKMYMSGDRVNDAHIDKKAMVFSYIEGDDYYFMDNETYEQVPISIAKLEWEKNFLRENAPVEISYYQDEILGIALPVKVPLKVVKSDPAVKGDTARNVNKEAILETGYAIKVPLFIDEGEEVIVRTDTGEYDSRA